MVGGGDPIYPKFWVNWPRWYEIADFEPIFALIWYTHQSDIQTNIIALCNNDNNANQNTDISTLQFVRNLHNFVHIISMQSNGWSRRHIIWFGFRLRPC